MKKLYALALMLPLALAGCGGSDGRSDSNGGSPSITHPFERLAKELNPSTLGVSTSSGNIQVFGNYGSVYGLFSEVKLRVNDTEAIFIDDKYEDYSGFTAQAVGYTPNTSTFANDYRDLFDYEVGAYGGSFTHYGRSSTTDQSGNFVLIDEYKVVFPQDYSVDEVRQMLIKVIDSQIDIKFPYEVAGSTDSNEFFLLSSYIVNEGAGFVSMGVVPFSNFKHADSSYRGIYQGRDLLVSKTDY